MLYLVEYAHWNSQAKIGYGLGNSSGIQNVGGSDSITYHTGTPYSSRTTYGVGVQYRYIEGLWDNCFDFIDGCYCNTTGALNIILNPNNFSDSSGGTFVGNILSGWSVPTAFNIVNVNGIFYFFIPSSNTSSNIDITYMCDVWTYNSSKPSVYTGGSYARDNAKGFFYTNTWDGSDVDLGSRLMVLPSQRLN